LEILVLGNRIIR